MANTYTTLNDLFTAIADAIRAKKQSTDVIVADNFPAEIEGLRTGFDYVNSEVTSIPDNAFYGCEDLNTVDCSNVASVGTNAFKDCTNLKTVVLYDGVADVGENSFQGCDNVIISYKGSTIPETWNTNWNPDNRPVLCGEPIQIWDISATSEDNVTAKLYVIDDKYTLFIDGNGGMKNYNEYSKTPWYYSYSANITSILINKDITNIGSYVFDGCSSLITIDIHSNIITIGEGAFSHCDNLTSIDVNEANQFYRSMEGVIFDKQLKQLIKCPQRKSGDYVVPNSVTDIEEEAFSYCKSLTSVTIPDSVTSIGQGAFSYCKSLTSVTIPDSVTSISSGMFRESGLTSVTIPESVTMIGNSVFSYCYSLTSITIPDSVTSIGQGAFYYCKSLTSITIPESVTSIYPDTFYACSKLTSVTIQGVTSIGYNAFYNCTNLTSINIPAVISLDYHAFYLCDKLTSITLGNNLTTIKDRAFDGCTNLTSITYVGTIAQWSAISFSYGWDYSIPDYTIHCTDGDIAKDGTITYHNN